MRFTIRRFMVAVVFLAGFLVMPSSAKLLTVVFAVPIFVVVLAGWLRHRRYTRIAAVAWGCGAVLFNGLYILAGTYPHYMVLGNLFIAWAVIVVPLVGSLGLAWALLATRDAETTAGYRVIPWVLVVTSVVLPGVTLSTLWPLRLAFFFARPGMERLADRVEAGGTLSAAEWHGPYSIAGVGAEPSARIVGLYTDPDPNGRGGFVRVHPGDPEEPRFQRLLGTDLNIDLGGGWTFRQDD